MKRLFPPLLTLILAMLACGAPTPLASPAPDSPPADLPIANPSFAISVEYGILGVAQAYADAGVTYSKLQDAFALWGNIEPEPGRYEWGPLDALVQEYQQAGFTGLQMNTAAHSPWASSDPPALGNEGDTFPQEQYLDEYAAYVTALVERYDLDGTDDMLGLLYPIHEYGIEREFTGFWPGTAEEYVRLLRISYTAVKAADSEANVLLVALLMLDIFDGNPSPEEIEQRLSVEIDYMRKSVSDIRTILAACDAYDIVDFHSLGNYTEIPLTAQWIRDELETNGCGEKPIWIGDAFPMSGLVGFGGFVPPTPFAPATLETRDAVVAALTSVADPNDENHAESQAWLYAEIARSLVRKIVVSAGDGLRGINIGNLEDWKTRIASIDRAAVPAVGAAMFFGITDTTITAEKPGGEIPFTGQDWSKARRVGDLRPAYYALALVTEKIGQFTTVEKLNLGEGVWAYRFETPPGPVWVLWYDDYALYLPGETPPTVTVNLPFDFTSALLTFTPTAIGQSAPETQTLQVVGDSLTFYLGATPVFIEVTP
ncbi:MAG: hypothetical protein HY781_02860 [Chloroflexi bacterium]|nr:hypothetical protein [Chloroflexota bacterium]